MLLFAALICAALAPPGVVADCGIADACGSSDRVFVEGWSSHVSRSTPSAVNPLAGHNDWLDRGVVRLIEPTPDACGGSTHLSGWMFLFDRIAPSYCNQTIDLCFFEKTDDGAVGDAFYCETHLLTDLRDKKDRSVDGYVRVFSKVHLDRPTSGYAAGYLITGDYGQTGDTILLTSGKCEAGGGWVLRAPSPGPGGYHEPFWQSYADATLESCGVFPHIYPIVGACQPCDVDVSTAAAPPDPVGWNFGTAEEPDWCPEEPEPARPWLTRDLCGVCSGDGSTCDGSACDPMQGVHPTMDCIHHNDTTNECDIYWGYTNDCGEDIIVLPEEGANWVNATSLEGTLPPSCFEPGCNKHAFRTRVPCDNLELIEWQVVTGISPRPALFDPNDPRDTSKQCRVDCNGDLNGGAVIDECGNCYHPKDPLFNRACQDCTGVPNGLVRIDRCGVCGGDGSSCLGQGEPCGPLSHQPALPCGPLEPALPTSSLLQCVDGVCCAGACAGLCEACDVPGRKGHCVRFEEGTDPRSECSDGHVCNGIESCPAADAEGVDRHCVTAVPAPDCDDHNVCTLDFCSDGEGRCFNTPLPGVGEKCLLPGVNATTIDAGVSACDYGVTACVEMDGEPAIMCVGAVGPRTADADEFPAFCHDEFEGVDDNCNGIVDEGCSNVCRPAPHPDDHYAPPEVPCPPSDTPCVVNECREVDPSDPFLRVPGQADTGYRCVPVVQVGAACDDGAACTTDDLCLDNGQCEGTDVVCDDDNVCTSDACSHLSGECVFTDTVGTPCDDNDPCTVGDECWDGICFSSPKVCDDSNPCTDDSCDPDTGVCVFVANSHPCDDGLRCTDDDVCTEGQCVGVPKTCEDDNDCTDCSCSEEEGKCSCWAVMGQDVPCNVCDPCNPGVCSDVQCDSTPVDCDDQDPCTADSCVVVHAVTRSFINRNRSAFDCEELAAMCVHEPDPNAPGCSTTTTAAAASTTTSGASTTSAASTTAASSTTTSGASTTSAASTTAASSTTTSGASTTSAASTAASSTTSGASTTSAASTTAASSTTSGASTTSAASTTAASSTTTAAVTSTTSSSDSGTSSDTTSTSTTGSDNGTTTTSSDAGSDTGTATTSSDAGSDTGTTGDTSGSTTTATTSSDGSATTEPADTSAGYNSMCTMDEQCTDGNFCNGLERCIDGHCIGAGMAPRCDDNNPCTEDYCDHDTNQCEHVTSPACSRRDDGFYVHERSNKVYGAADETHVGHNHDQEVEPRHGYYDDDDDYGHRHYHDNFSAWWVLLIVIPGAFLLFCVVYASVATPTSDVKVNVPDGYKLVPSAGTGRRFRDHVDVINQIRSKHYQ